MVFVFIFSKDQYFPIPQLSYANFSLISKYIIDVGFHTLIGICGKIQNPHPRYITPEYSRYPILFAMVQAPSQDNDVLLETPIWYVCVCVCVL